MDDIVLKIIGTMKLKTCKSKTHLLESLLSLILGVE